MHLVSGTGKVESSLKPLDPPKTRIEQETRQVAKKEGRVIRHKAEKVKRKAVFKALKAKERKALEQQFRTKERFPGFKVCEYRKRSGILVLQNDGCKALPQLSVLGEEHQQTDWGSFLKDTLKSDAARHGGGVSKTVLPVHTEQFLDVNEADIFQIDGYGMIQYSPIESERHKEWFRTESEKFKGFYRELGLPDTDFLDHNLAIHHLVSTYMSDFTEEQKDQIESFLGRYARTREHFTPIRNGEWNQRLTQQVEMEGDRSMALVSGARHVMYRNLDILLRGLGGIVTRLYVDTATFESVDMSKGL